MHLSQERVQSALMLPIASCVYSLHMGQLRGDCFILLSASFGQPGESVAFGKQLPEPLTRPLKLIWPLGKDCRCLAVSLCVLSA